MYLPSCCFRCVIHQKPAEVIVHFISPNTTGHFVCDQSPSSINRPADTSYTRISDEVRMNHSVHVDLSLEEIKTTENFMQVGGMKVELVMDQDGTGER